MGKKYVWKHIELRFYNILEEYGLLTYETASLYRANLHHTPGEEDVEFPAYVCARADENWSNKYAIKLTDPKVMQDIDYWAIVTTNNRFAAEMACAALNREFDDG